MLVVDHARFHSFPTRRSSDLWLHCLTRLQTGSPAAHSTRSITSLDVGNPRTRLSIEEVHRTRRNAERNLIAGGDACSAVTDDADLGRSAADQHFRLGPRWLDYDDFAGNAARTVTLHDREMLRSNAIADVKPFADGRLVQYRPTSPVWRLNNCIDAGAAQLAMDD